MIPAKVIYLAAGIFVVAGGALAGWFWWAGGAGDGLTPNDARIVARGRIVYTQSCAGCHGDNLQGQANWQDPLDNGRMPAPPHSAEGHTWHHTDELLIDLTSRGTQAVVGGGYESDMPAYGGEMPESDIIAVLSYIKSTWPEEIKAANDNINAQPRN